MPTETLISIIDDDEDFREAIARLMKSRGFTVDAFPSALAFLSCPNIRNTSCLIVDAHMPRMTGIELHRRLVESGYAIPTILSGYLDDSVRARAPVPNSSIALVISFGVRAAGGGLLMRPSSAAR